MLSIVGFVMAATVVTVPVPATTSASLPPVVSAGNPDEIAKDAARDLQDGHFYNRPGATRAEFDAAWQACRLIARGSTTPAGSYTYVYNPAVISPVAAGAGAGLGAAIGMMIVEGQLRRTNRAACLTVRGWRRIEVAAAERARVAKLSPDERSAYFDTMIGATDLKGNTVIEWHNDYAAPRLALEGGQ